MAAPARVTRKGHGTILLVEDNGAVLEWASRILAEHGYQVLPADNSTQAVEVAFGKPIDLLDQRRDYARRQRTPTGGASQARSARHEGAIPLGLYRSCPRSNWQARAGMAFLAQTVEPEALLAKIDDVLGRRIVLADDDPEVRKVLTAILQPPGCQVRPAQTDVKPCSSSGVRPLIC